MSAARAFVYVQHLLGIGHLKRAAALARALAALGMQVSLASGGTPVPGLELGPVRLVQLPPASTADASFKVLLDERGLPLDEAWKRRRAERLLAAWREAAAQVLVVELFPFGRRQMRFELLPLLDAAAAAPRKAAIFCSVRDILGAQKSPQRQEESRALVERYFDRVLVHGDPQVIPFERTFPGAARMAERIAYTGYVVEASAQAAGAAGTDEVIVSAGGGAVGARLLDTALRARPLTALRDRTWRLLAGDNLPAAQFEALARLAGAGGRVQLERSRRDFTGLLANCAVSVSQAGYNTLIETLQARARAVVVPFAGGHETEQTLRARCFAERGLVECVEESALTPASLGAAIDRAAARDRPAPGAISLDGARNSAALIAQALQRGGT